MKLGAFFSHRHGFTLVELMVTLAVAAILATVAAPMLSRFLAKSQMNAVANELMGAIQLARTEAVNRNTCVTICRRAETDAATDTAMCAGSDGAWTNGWIVYPDPACTGEPEATDPPAGTAIRVQERVPEAITLTTDDGGALTGHLRITPRGVVSGAAMTMRLNDSRFTDRSNAVDIVVSMQGRVRRNSVDPL